MSNGVLRGDGSYSLTSVAFSEGKRCGRSILVLWNSLALIIVLFDGKQSTTHLQLSYLINEEGAQACGSSTLLLRDDR